MNSGFHDAAAYNRLAQPHCRMGERFVAWSRSLAAGSQSGSLYSPLKPNEKWTLESLPLTVMMLWSDGTNAGAVPVGTA
jgi:hypothetical protein